MTDNNHLKVAPDELDVSTTATTEHQQSFSKSSQRSGSMPQVEYSAVALAIKESDWRQMRCKHKELTFGKHWVQCIYIIIALIFIPIGAITYNISQNVTEQEFEAYSDYDGCSIDDYSENATWGRECTVNYTLDYDFEAPIYFYYKITSMYANHRSYVMSRNDDQLRGDASSTSDCDPMTTSDYNGKKLLACGLISYSFFNDKYKVVYVDSDSGDRMPLCNTTQCDKNEQEMNWTDASWYAEPNWSKKHIAWASDRNERFKYVELTKSTTRIGELQHWQKVTLPDTNDEDFIVWMRTSTAPTFLKLHRIIKDKSFKKGDILEITIKNYFEVGSFDGSKSIVISSVGGLGGRNDALGIGFMVVGGISLLTAVLFCVFFHSSRDEMFATVCNRCNLHQFRNNTRSLSQSYNIQLIGNDDTND